MATTIPRDVLLLQYTTISNELAGYQTKKIEAGDTSFDAAITDAKNRLAEVLETLKTADSPKSPELAYAINTKINTLITIFKQITKFSPGGNAEAWIDELNRLYLVHIEPELTEYPTLETEFVKSCKMSMDKVLFTQMQNSAEKIDNYEEFRAYFLKTHGTRRSVFATLNKCWDLKLGDNEKVTTFAARLDKQMREAMLRIEQKYAKENPDSDFKTEAVFSIVSSMLLTEQLRQRQPVVYAHITRKLDKMWSPISIAEEAQVFVDRGVGNIGEPGVNVVKVNSAVVEKSKSRSRPKPKAGKQTPAYKSNHSNDRQTQLESNMKRKGECINYSVGRPCFRNPCPFKHVDKYGKLVHNVPGHNNNTNGSYHRGGPSVSSQHFNDHQAICNAPTSALNAGNSHYGDTGHAGQTVNFDNMFQPINFQ